jgi:hypothetical protein
LECWNSEIFGKASKKQKPTIIPLFHHPTIPLFQFVKAMTVTTESDTLGQDGGRDHGQNKKGE